MRAYNLIIIDKFLINSKCFIRVLIGLSKSYARSIRIFEKKFKITKITYKNEKRVRALNTILR